MLLINDIVIDVNVICKYQGGVKTTIKGDQGKFIQARKVSKSKVDVF